MVASTTIPVSPMPPAVAQKSSGSCSGEISTRPVGVANDSRVTYEQNEPSRWWFLPWMSAAMAPPTVTWRVPGLTGTNQPRGTKARIRESRLTPAPTRTTPASTSASNTVSRPVTSSTIPPAHCAASP
jgi:hypothetical protein